jgi:hypothetical protein
MGDSTVATHPVKHPTGPTPNSDHIQVNVIIHAVVPLLKRQKMRPPTRIMPCRMNTNSQQTQSLAHCQHAAHPEAGITVRLMGTK